MITLHFRGDKEKPHKLTRKDFLDLKKSGFLWEFYPHAPQEYPKKFLNKAIAVALAEANDIPQKIGVVLAKDISKSDLEKEIGDIVNLSHYPEIRFDNGGKVIIINEQWRDKLLGHRVDKIIIEGSPTDYESKFLEEVILPFASVVNNPEFRNKLRKKCGEPIHTLTPKLFYVP